MEATESAASLATWWTEFQDPTLDRLVNEAVAGNLDLKIAAARIREARAARGIASSAGRPQVGSGSRAYARTRNSPFGPGDQNVFEAGIRRQLGDRRLRRREERQGGGPRRRPGGRGRTTRGPGRHSWPTSAAATWSCAARSNSSASSRRPWPRSGTPSTSRKHGRKRASPPSSMIGPRRRAPESQRSPDRPVPGARGESRHLPPGRPRRKGAERPRPTSSKPRRTSRPSPPDPPDTPLRAPLPAPGPEARRARARRRHRPHRRRPSGPLPEILDPRRRLNTQLELPSPTVRWPIFSGGRIHANIEVHTARQEQALLQYEKQILTALEEVETALSAHTRERSREASLRAAVDSTRRALALPPTATPAAWRTSSPSWTPNARSTPLKTNWFAARRTPPSP